METSKKVSIILTPEDLTAENIQTTVKTMEHHSNKFYLLKADWNTDLCYVIEDLSKESEDATLLTKTRMAYDLNFDLKTTLKIGDSDSDTELKAFADLLELMDFNENLILNRSDYHVIIDDSDSKSSDGENAADRAVAKLFQQIIFLNLNLDIQKKSEISKSLIKNRFREKYGELLQEVTEDKKYIETVIQHADLTADNKQRFEKINVAFDDILKEIAKAKTRPLRIAAMGTKKAGKSVVINSLLKRDYARTSSTLPTPNTIKYIPASPDSKIKLEYNGETYIFDTDKEIKSFIDDEFKRAQKITGKGAGLPDMTIYYPCDDLNGYEIWDTPGPNVAFTDEHRKNAEECIREVDVCIFVMNYSNHLTNDEMSFLRQIHSAFKENNKFYSLFIAVNRIDERYAVAEEKSVNRILDYIGGRLENLPTPYKNIVIFGTSALQSFYLDEVIELVKAERKVDGADENELPLVDLDSIDFRSPFSKKFTTDPEKTEISTIGDLLGKLYNFHDIENPTEKELYALSGIPQLFQYAKYISSQKADMEIVNSVVARCEEKFATINNAFLVTDLVELTEQDKERLHELGRLIEGLKNEVEQATRDIEPLIGDDKKYKAFHEIDNTLKSVEKSAQETAKSRTEMILNDLDLTPADVENIASNEDSEKLTAFYKNVGDVILGLNTQSAENLSRTERASCDDYFRAVETGTQKAQNKILQKISEVKASVQNTAEKNILSKFEFPQFPTDINRLFSESEGFQVTVDSNIEQIAEDAGKTEAVQKYRTEIEERTRIVTRPRPPKTTWEKVKAWFGAKYDEEVEETYQEEIEIPYIEYKKIYEVEKFKRTLLDSVLRKISAVINNEHDMMTTAVKAEVSSVFADVNKQCNDIREGYRNIFDSFKKDIDAAGNETAEHKKALENDIKVLNDIHEKVQPFLKIWNEILRA